MKLKWILLVVFVMSLICFAAGSALAAISDSDFLDLCETGNLQQIEEAINDGANINARNEDQETPLMWAAWGNPDPEVIAFLVKAGADIKAKDKEGDAPLMFAAISNSSAKIITALVEAGADVNAQNDKGSTPLILAVKFNTEDLEAQRSEPSPEVIITLLQLGADAKIKDNELKMAIDYAKEVESLKDTDALKQLNDASS